MAYSRGPRWHPSALFSCVSNLDPAIKSSPRLLKQLEDKLDSVSNWNAAFGALAPSASISDSLPDYTTPARCPYENGRTNPLTSGDLPDTFSYPGAPPDYTPFAPSNELINADAFCTSERSPATEHAHGKVLMKDPETGLCQTCPDATCSIWMPNTEGSYVQECTGKIKLNQTADFTFNFPMPGPEFSTGWGTEVYPHIHFRCEGCGGHIFNKWMAVPVEDYCANLTPRNKLMSSPDESNALNAAPIRAGAPGTFHIIMQEEWIIKSWDDDVDACWSTQWANPCPEWAAQADGADCSAFEGPPSEPDGRPYGSHRATVPSTLSAEARAELTQRQAVVTDESSAKLSDLSTLELAVICFMAVLTVTALLAVVAGSMLWVCRKRNGNAGHSNWLSSKLGSAPLAEPSQACEPPGDVTLAERNESSFDTTATLRINPFVNKEGREGLGSASIGAPMMPSFTSSANFLSPLSSSSSVVLASNPSFTAIVERGEGRTHTASTHGPSTTKLPPPVASCGGGGCPLPASTVRLVRELNSMVGTQPPVLFAGHYLIIGERESGGQALVQFARSHDGGYSQYAIKFFQTLEEFHLETSLYEDAALRSTLPALLGACPNDGAAMAQRAGPSGFVFPPHIIVERGTTLATWRAAQERHIYSVLNMFVDLAKHLEALHAAGHVHRDLKPANVLVMLQSQSWKLIDYGIAARAGDVTAPSCTLAYAAPEVVKAYSQRRTIEVHPAQDIWALGVMVYECMVNKPLFPPFSGREDILAAAHGQRAYPWENPGDWPDGFKKVPSRVRGAVLQCLLRDPTERPETWLLVHMVGRLGNTTSTERVVLSDCDGHACAR